MSYRGRYVSYGSKSITFNDPGHVSSLGDRMWTDYSGFGPVQVYKGSKKVGPEFESIFTHIDGYRLTFSDHVGGEQILLLGDFTFLRGSSPKGCSMYHQINHNYLIVSKKDLSTKDILNRIGMIKVNIGVDQEHNQEGHTINHGNHISPFTRGKKKQTSDNDAGYLQRLYEDNSDVCTCGGAVRVKHDGKLRWLFPHPVKGAQAAWDHMTNTDMEDDWAALMKIINGALSIERERVLAGFSGSK